MKCPICDGGGRITSLPSGMPVKCTRCNGTGEVQMTNFDNIAKNEDTLAKWLSDKLYFCKIVSCDECTACVSDDECKDVTNSELWSAWLKQPRKEEEMMYLVEGRNPHETRGQYVLSKESAYAILEEMKQDFLKVNIYEKVDGEYKRIEKWEREQTNYDWLNSLPIEEQAEAIANLVFRATGEYNRERYPSNRWFEKEYWLTWLKQPHNRKE